MIPFVVKSRMLNAVALYVINRTVKMKKECLEKTDKTCRHKADPADLGSDIRIGYHTC